MVDEEKRQKSLFERVTRKDVAIFSRQLSLLLDAGLTLISALRVISKRTSKQKFSDIIASVADGVEQGNTFANSLSQHPKLFPELFVNIVKVGEVGGALEHSLRRLADFTERELRYRSKVISAMLYPFFAILVSILVICVILTFVFPILLGLFEGKEDKLHWLTRGFASTGDVIRDWWFLFLAIFVGLMIGYSWFRKTPFGRKTIDTIKLRFKLPFFGQLGQKIVVGRLSEMYSLLLKSGVQVIPALRVVSQSSGNVIVEEAFIKVADEVEKGHSMQDTLRAQNVFPPIVVDLIGVGEEAGTLDIVLDKIQESYNEEVDLALENLNRVIEPFLILFLGGMVLLIAVAAYLPYFNLGSVLEYN